MNGFIDKKLEEFDKNFLDKDMSGWEKSRHEYQRAFVHQSNQESYLEGLKEGMDRSGANKTAEEILAIVNQIEEKYAEMQRESIEAQELSSVLEAQMACFALEDVKALIQSKYLP